MRQPILTYRVLYISFLYFSFFPFMDTFFGRKKSRQRQSSLSQQDLGERSIPYDQLPAALRSPIPVATINQGIRGISAPNTNPSLTDSGTDMNNYAIQKHRRLNDIPHRPESSTNSVPSAGSSNSPTLYDDLSTPTPSPRHVRTQAHRSELSFAGRDPSNTDLGQLPSPNDQSITPSRPSSAMTTKSDYNRSSRYAASVSSEGGSSHHHHHHSSISQLYHRPPPSSDTFKFPRPATDAEIEVLFENVKRTRDFPDLPRNLTVDHKWHLVYNDEHIRWDKEKQKELQSKKQKDLGQSTGVVPDSPEWYLKKFVDKTITAKQVQSLGVSLRSNEMRYLLLLQKSANISDSFQLGQSVCRASRHFSSRKCTVANQQERVI